MKNFTLLFPLIIFIFSSCKKDKNVSVPFTGYSYAPDNIGHEIIYDVDSIIKNDFDGLIHTTHYQIKELIADTFTDNQGRPTLRLERYKRNTPSDPWVIYRVWSANRTTVHYEKKEDNITYVKLIFPPHLNSKWDGNAQNTLGYQEYEYTALNTPDTYNGLSFDSALTVVQYDYFDGVLDSAHYEEKYAAGAGMYFKLQDSIHFDYISDTILYRRLYKEEIVSYSN